ncbi:MAG: hypothetical protein KIC94_06375 [Clostridiales bacterium]|nr:hypothetical protein [Clostridiales bacterium]
MKKTLPSINPHLADAISKISYTLNIDFLSSPSIKTILQYGNVFIVTATDMMSYSSIITAASSILEFTYHHLNHTMAVGLFSA